MMGHSFRFSQGLQTRWGVVPCETSKRCILLTALALTFQFSSLAAEDGTARTGRAGAAGGGAPAERAALGRSLPGRRALLRGRGGPVR